MKRYGWVWIPAFLLLSILLMIVAGCIGIERRPMPEIAAVSVRFVPAPPSPDKPLLAVPATAEVMVITNVPQPPKGVHLQWTTVSIPTSNDVAGFRVYMGYTSAQWEQNFYVNNTNKGRTLPYTNVINVTNLRAHPYVFAVAGVDMSGLEGPLSQIDTWNLFNTNGTPSVSNNVVHLYIWAASNRSYLVETSPTLKTWSVLTNFSNLSGVYSFRIGSNLGKGYQRVTLK